MALCKALVIAATSMAIVVGALLPAIARPDNHVVGEQKWWAGPNVHVVGEMEGWRLGADYDAWARVNTPIPAGDKLHFRYNPALHNVVVLTDEDSYSRCVVPANNVQTFNTGDDMLVLPNPGKFFFFCSNGVHCSAGGMKFAITVI